MSYKFLDHATDAIIEVTAKNLKEAFAVAADAEINLTLDQDKVEEKGQMEFSANGKDLHYLLFSWLRKYHLFSLLKDLRLKDWNLTLKKKTDTKSMQLHMEKH